MNARGEAGQVKDGEAVAAAQHDRGTIAAVGAAHFASHFLQLALAPVLPLVRQDLAVSYTELGLVMAALYVTSGAGQIVAGVLVDRFGAHRLLLGGLALQGLAVASMGLAPSFPVLLALAALTGLGNSVYHPADLSILSQKVTGARLGRAFATHTVGGVVGFAVSPLFIGLTAAGFGWRAALIAGGLLALAIWTGLMFCRGALRTEGAGPIGQAAAGEAPRQGFLAALAGLAPMPVVVSGFLFFLLLAVSEQSVQSFAIAALTEGYGATLVWATLAVTGYQLGRVAGILAGGVIADRTARHHVVTVTGLGVSALLILVIATPGLPLAAVVALLAAAGLAKGAAMPSRDVLIRNAAPPGSYGKVFGAVYSGLDAGSLVTPLICGTLLDKGLPAMVFVTSATALALAAAMVQLVRARAVVPQPAE